MKFNIKAPRNSTWLRTIQPAILAVALFLLSWPLAIRAQTLGTNTITISLSDPQAAKLTLNGPSFAIFLLQVCTNLLAPNWQNLWTGEANEYGGLTVMDVFTNASARFYRSATIPRIVATTSSAQVTENVGALIHLTANGVTNNSQNGGIHYEIISPSSIGQLYQVAGDDVTPTTPMPPEQDIMVSNPDGWIYYVPAHDYYGSQDSFIYCAFDFGGVPSDGEFVSLMVAHVNQPPVASPQTLTFWNDIQTNELSLTGYDPDNDNSQLTVCFVNLPNTGTLYFQDGTNLVPVVAGQPYDTWSFYYSSAALYDFGTNYAEFSFYLQDPDGLDSAIVTNEINLVDMIDPPVSTTPASYTFDEASNLVITLSGWDSQTNVTYRHYLTSLPSHGNLIFYEDGTAFNLTNYPLPILLPANPGVSPQVTYFPYPYYNSAQVTDGFSFSLEVMNNYTGARAASSNAVSLIVTPVNQPPSISGQTNGVTVWEATNGAVLQDGAITNLVITDEASYIPGANVSLIVQIANVQRDTVANVYAGQAPRGVAVTQLNPTAIELEGSPAALHAFIAMGHIFVHPNLPNLVTQLEITVNDEGGVVPGNPGPPLQTTIYVPINYVTP